MSFYKVQFEKLKLLFIRLKDSVIDIAGKSGYNELTEGPVGIIMKGVFYGNVYC